MKRNDPGAQFTLPPGKNTAPLLRQAGHKGLEEKTQPFHDGPVRKSPRILVQLFPRDLRRGGFDRLREFFNSAGAFDVIGTIDQGLFPFGNKDGLTVTPLLYMTEIFSFVQCHDLVLDPQDPRTRIVFLLQG